MGKELKKKLALTLFATCAFLICTPTKSEAMVSPHYYYTFPAYYHLIHSITPSGRMVEITDESGWEVDPSYRFEASTWRQGEPLLISPTSITGQFYITNTQRNRYIVATLQEGPVKRNSHRCQIVSLNRRTGFIEMRSQRGEFIKWSADPNDRYILNKWKVGDVVIAGANDDFYSAIASDYTSTLINVYRYPSYVRTKLY